MPSHNGIDLLVPLGFLIKKGLEVLFRDIPSFALLLAPEPPYFEVFPDNFKLQSQLALRWSLSRLWKQKTELHPQGIPAISLIRIIAPLLGFYAYELLIPRLGLNFNGKFQGSLRGVDKVMG
jgi:hypothetical protein